MKRTINSLYDASILKEKAIDKNRAVAECESTLNRADALLEQYMKSNKRDNQLKNGDLVVFENKPSRFAVNQNSTYEVFKLRNGHKILVAQYE